MNSKMKIWIFPPLSGLIIEQYEFGGNFSGTANPEKVGNISVFDL